jgi:mycothiol maleylpyruvate isomerase-like protein
MKPRVKQTAASVRRRAEDEYKKLDAIVRRLRPADFDRYAFDEQAPIRWTVKDVIAHITAWKWRDVRRLTRDRSPLKPYDAPYGAGVHEPNAAIYWRSHRTPARTIVAEHRAAHRALLKALLEAPPEHFARRWSPGWPADSVGHVESHRRMHLDPLFAKPPKR